MISFLMKYKEMDYYNSPICISVNNLYQNLGNIDL